MTHAASIETTVPFHDCDPLFVVWHGRYFDYLALARTELLRRLDLDIPQIRDLGYRMYVTDARCRYMYPMRYGDRVRVTARLHEVTPLIHFVYGIDNLTHNRKTARASTTLATLDPDGTLLTATPEPILSRLRGPVP